MKKLGIDLSELQGNVLKGYRRTRVRYLILEITSAAKAREWLGELVAGTEGLPQITSAKPWPEGEKPEYCFNLSFTYEGLRALGWHRAPNKNDFPKEFRQGMHNRSVKLGDVGDSAPENWPPPFDKPDSNHIIVSIYANSVEKLDEIQQLTGNSSDAFSICGTRDGGVFDEEQPENVHFGYRDNISQPRFRGIHDPERYPDDQPLCALGTVLLGPPDAKDEDGNDIYDTGYEGVYWTIPYPDVMGNNGSFNAFRILEQDVQGFEDYLEESATALQNHPLVEELLPRDAEQDWGYEISRHDALKEVVAAKMCGRWRTGVPIELSPYNPNPKPDVPWSQFEYGEHAQCPYGAHIRRCNPRGGHIVQRVANNTRRLVRRGMPYGPGFDPAKPDDEERGLLGNFICADLGAQFEAVQYDWLNLGLQDPRITGCNDPLLGANDERLSWFDIPLPSGEVIRLYGLPRFVLCRGGAYTFIPSIPGLRYLSGLGH